MIKVEDIQQYGKQHFDTVVASASGVQTGLQAIASAYGDYTKKSFEETKSFVEKLSGVRSLDKALEVQSEYAKSAYESFVSESQKIAGPTLILPGIRTSRWRAWFPSSLPPLDACVACSEQFQPGRLGRAFSLGGCQLLFNSQQRNSGRTPASG